MKSRKNREIEIKLRVADPAALRRRLGQLGAQRLRRVHEHNTLYDTAQNSLGRSGRLLRLRLERALGPGRGKGALQCSGEPALLTFKSPIGRDSRYKVREEREAIVSDAAQLDSILQAMGFRPWFRYEKRRTSYRLRSLSGLHFELDETPIGVFVELEGPKAAIRRAARLLGYGPRDFVTASYRALYCEDCRRRRRKPGNMLF
jgi:adenylate cyclase class 2